MANRARRGLNKPRAAASDLVPASISLERHHGAGNGLEQMRQILTAGDTVEPRPFDVVSSTQANGLTKPHFRIL